MTEINESCPIIFTAAGIPLSKVKGKPAVAVAEFEEKPESKKTKAEKQTFRHGEQRGPNGEKQDSSGNKRQYDRRSATGRYEYYLSFMTLPYFVTFFIFVSYLVEGRSARMDLEGAIGARKPM